MNNTNEMWQQIEQVLQESIALQQKQLLSAARRIVSHLTTEDLLQPNDFPELECHPHFRYEEGVLHGLYMVQAALKNLQTETL